MAAPKQRRELYDIMTSEMGFTERVIFRVVCTVLLIAIFVQLAR